MFGELVQYPVLDITPTYLRQMVIATLREADYRANQALTEHGAMQKITQMPVVLLPIHFDRDPSLIFPESSMLRSVVLRPFITHDFMTGRPAVPGKDLELSVSAVLRLRIHAFSATDKSK